MKIIIRNISMITLALAIGYQGKSQDDQNLTAQKVIGAYLELKDALVNTNVESASTAAGGFNVVIGNSEEKLLKSILMDAKLITASKDVMTQRTIFKNLSEKVYELVKTTNANEETLYKQYCPMAIKNTGAYWLSVSSEIENPYFGDMMLTCGSTKETIK